MAWHLLFGPDHEPSFDDISTYIGSDLWNKLNCILQDTYKTAPKRTYSKCGGAPGWNVKYQKGGKSLCTLYPHEGFFVALVVIGNKETPETELILPTLSGCVQEMYGRVPFLCGGKWLMITVDSARVFEDVTRLITIRAKAK